MHPDPNSSFDPLASGSVHAWADYISTDFGIQNLPLKHGQAHTDRFQWMLYIHWQLISCHGRLCSERHMSMNTHTHTQTHGTRKVKPIWILLKQETVSGNGISWAIRKTAPRSRQITTPVPHHSVFYGPDALPATQPTVSKHWRRKAHEHEVTLKSSVCCLYKIIIFNHHRHYFQTSD